MFQLLCLPTKTCFKLTSRLKPACLMSPACLSRVFTASHYPTILQVHQALISKFKNKITNSCAEKYMNFVK